MLQGSSKSGGESTEESGSGLNSVSEAQLDLESPITIKPSSSSSSSHHHHHLQVDMANDASTPGSSNNQTPPKPTQDKVYLSHP